MAYLYLAYSRVHNRCNIYKWGYNMDKRKTDRLSINPITKQLINFVIDRWVERCIMAIKFERSFNIKQETTNET